MPVAAIAATQGSIFLSFGSAAFVVALPYLVSAIREKCAAPQAIGLAPASD